MPIRYVSTFTSKLVDDEGQRVTQLLWGDPVHVTGSVRNGMYKARARARPVPKPGGPGRPWGWVSAADLSPASKLLEVYVIDVGQGDSVLMRTPDDKWHVIDGGVSAEKQMTKKGSANFIRWKFLDDLRRDTVALETVILTHPDEDHYGGFVNLLSGRVPLRPTPFKVEVERFYHSGIANFEDEPKIGGTVAGEVDPLPFIGHRIRREVELVTELLAGKMTFRNPPREFAPRFAEFAKLVGQVPKQVARLSRDDRYLPGYAPGDGDVTIHVLGPVVEQLSSGERGLRVLGKDGMTKNGHSIVLRADYGSARVLLTGDLNSASQRLLLSYQPPDAFSADVAKACHHGAEDVELEFVKAMQARATVVSSGDNEVHSHPRPLLLGASARYGREGRDEHGRLMPPLIYSTELARSVQLCYASGVRVRVGSGADAPKKQFAVAATELRPDASGMTYRRLDGLALSTNLVYGLVNVRTDGRHILCATMEEAGTEFDVKVFKAGG
ncbi:MAG: MBL fold metallo-hydrolase [Gemmatimonadota bacterium]|nr:MBL fold metallo-hydrolase [Gemmatimonadota bacterium]